MHEQRGPCLQLCAHRRPRKRHSARAGSVMRAPYLYVPSSFALSRARLIQRPHLACALFFSLATNALGFKAHQCPRFGGCGGKCHRLASCPAPTDGLLSCSLASPPCVSLCTARAVKSEPRSSELTNKMQGGGAVASAAVKCEHSHSPLNWHCSNRCLCRQSVCCAVIGSLFNITVAINLSP
jgi:hypothetical protein